jgi:hypothetical protein
MIAKVMINNNAINILFISILYRERAIAASSAFLQLIIIVFKFPPKIYRIFHLFEGGGCQIILLSFSEERET